MTRPSLWGGIAVLAAIALWVSGVPLTTSLLLIVLVACQGLAGGLWWRWARGARTGPVEELGVGLALGTAGATLAGLMGLVLPVRVDLRGWAAMTPAVVTLVIWIVARSRGRRLTPGRGMDRPSFIACIVGLVFGGAALAANLRNYPLRWTGMWDAMHPDMLFFQALSTSSAAFGPGDSTLLTGHGIRYHWLVYAWTGQLDQMSHAEPFVVLSRVLPLVALIASVAIAAGWAARATRIPWAPTIAVLLIVSGGYVGATYGTVLNIDSPSQALTSAWLLAFTVAVLGLTRHTPGIGLIVLISMLAVAMSGGKVSTGAVAVGSIALLAVVGILRREPWRARMLLAAGASAIGLVAVYALMLAGSGERGGLLLFRLIDKASSVQGLNPVNTRLGVLVGTVILVLAVVPRWAGLGWIVADPRSRWRPMSILGIGLALAGASTLVVVSGGLNDTWFALAASAPLAVISAVGCGRAVRMVSGRLWPARTVWIAVAVALLLAVLVSWVWASGPIPDGRRWLAPLIGIGGAVAVAAVLSGARDLRRRRAVRFIGLLIAMLVVMAVPGRLLGGATASAGVLASTSLTTGTFSPFLPFIPARDQELVTSLSDDQMRLASLLRARSTPTDVVATNVTFSPLVAAITGRPTFVSGIKYQAPYGSPDDVPLMLEREQASYAYIASPSPATVQPLCDAGVRWVWVDPTRTANRTWDKTASVEATSPNAIVLRLTACD